MRGQNIVEWKRKDVKCYIGYYLHIFKELVYYICIYTYVHIFICIHTIYIGIDTHILGIMYLFSRKKDKQKSNTTSPSTNISLHLIGHKQVTWPPIIRKEPGKSTVFKRGRGLLSLAGTNHGSFMFQTKWAFGR